MTANLKAAIAAAIAAKQQQASWPEPTDAERLEAIIAALAKKDERAGQIRHILNIGPDGEIKPQRPAFDLAAFKRAQVEKELARAPLSTPTAADLAPAEEPPGRPPTDARHYKSWLSKVEKWFSTRPEPPPMPEIKSPDELRAEREAEAAQRRRQDAQIREIQSANEQAIRARFGPSFSWMG